MFGSADLKLCGTALLLVLGSLANIFNLVVMLVQQWRSGCVKTVAVIICFISLGNVLLQISTFVLVASVWAGVLCWPDLPFFFCVVLFVWLSSSSVSFWSVAWLSVFYCMRVLSFSSVIFRAKTLVPKNMTERASCVIRKPLFPAWVVVNVYVVIFICYLALMPLMIMLPTSLRLVVYLCKHSLSMRKQQSGSHAAESYLLVCRLTVALVWRNCFLKHFTLFSFFFYINSRRFSAFPCTSVTQADSCIFIGLGSDSNPDFEAYFWSN
uniref:Taste receptor type 2 n=1 Tax=Seriola lalandi dorsalis TaxID=1841481 RepID=A0A3B4X2N5_SERLL